MMNRERLNATLMFFLFIAPLAMAFAPIPEVEAADAGRTLTSDLQVNQVMISSGGSIDTGADILLATGLHLVSISVSNIGTSASGGTLILRNGSSISGAADTINTITIPSIAPGTIGSPLIIEWNANSGPLQRLEAEAIATVNDPNSLNNKGLLDFKVLDYQQGNISSITVPQPDLGQSEVRITGNTLSVSSIVRNLGTINVAAQMRLSLTNGTDVSSPLSDLSANRTLVAGTLVSISQAMALSVDMDVSQIEGDWDLKVDLIYWGASGEDTEVALPTPLSIEFSNYNSHLSTPADRSTQPGATTQLTFVLRNIGSAADSFDVTIATSKGWADNSLDGTTTDVISIGGMLSLVVPTAVPENVDRSDIDRIDISLTSNNGAYSLTGTVVVMAGDLYRSEVSSPHMEAKGVVWLVTDGVGGVVLTDLGTNYLDIDGNEVIPDVEFSGGGGSGAIATAVMDGTGSVSSITIDNAGSGYTSSPIVTLAAPGNAQHHTPIVPGFSANIPFSILNTGNVPGSFNLETGLSSAANGWTLELATSTTDIIPVGENRIVNVNVSAPSLKNPLDPSNRLRDGESIGLWLSASPSVGGAAVSAEEALVVQPTIIVDPGLAESEIILTPEQVLSVVGSTGIEEFVDMQIEVVHNLVNGPSDTVDVQIDIGNLTFVPLTSGGLGEAMRWNASSSTTAASLALGQIQSSSLGILGPSDILPLAGTLTIPIIASPTISNAQLNANVFATAVTRYVTIVIPEIADGELNGVGGNLSVVPGFPSSFDLKLTNTGNDMTGYLISVANGAPIDWIIGVNGGATTTQILSVPPQMQQHPNLTGDEVVNITLNLSVPANTPAGVQNQIELVVSDLSSGILLSSRVYDITTEETIAMNVEVDEVKMDIATGGQRTLMIYIENTGNVLTYYDLDLDTSQSGDVVFILDGDDEIPIAAGFKAGVRIRVAPSSEANSDFNHLATLSISNTSGISHSVLINVSINASMGVLISIPPTPDVIPGEDLSFTITINNSGNLLQNVTLMANTDSNWPISLSQDVFELPQNQETEIQVIIEVPPLDEEGGMANGETHGFYVTAIDTISKETIGTNTANLEVAAVFQLNYSDWDDISYFHATDIWEFHPMLMNTGNSNVTVEIDYDVLRPGGVGVMQDWELVPGKPSVLNLPMGVWVPLVFKVKGVEISPDLDLAGELHISMRPVDTNISGSAELTSNLTMSRMFSTGEAVSFSPKVGGAGSVTQLIPWSHIPTGTNSVGNYEIALCGIERLINTSLLVDPGFDEWGFSIQVGNNETLLPMNPDCDSPDLQRISLPPAMASVKQQIYLWIATPIHPYLVADDGWNLSLRLFNLEDNRTTNATFGFKIINVANPALSNPRLSTESGDTVEEDLDITFMVDLINKGTATAIGVDVSLTCSDGAGIFDNATQTILILPPQEEMILEWKISPDRLDWWAHSAGITCSVSLESMLAAGNDVDDDAVEFSGTVQSWSPNTSITVIGFALVLMLTGILMRLGSQSEKFIQGAAFTGSIGAGLAFHMGALFETGFSTFFSIAWLLIAAIWVMWIAWRSGEEFQLVHEDYQRAKQGESTIYSDHFSALKSAKKQLTIIMVVPIFGTVLIVLGIPPRLSLDALNIIMLFSYLLVVTGGVIAIINLAEKTYGSIYSRMIEINEKRDKMALELGDPARLLTELARSGLDLSSVLDNVPDAEGGESSD
jgi:uncharacterized membrane protein